jgi:predicted Zn-dependent protease with MMP-like domain
MKSLDDWHKHRAPTLVQFEAIAHAAYEKLPVPFREMTKDVVIRVDEFPTDEVLDSLGIKSPFGLLGLYHGVNLTNQSVFNVTTMPEMIFLYRRPILDYWAEHKDSLGEIITHVLVHEIGHHFGLSDDDMTRIESDAAG